LAAYHIDNLVRDTYKRYLPVSLQSSLQAAVLAINGTGRAGAADMAGPVYLKRMRRLKQGFEKLDCVQGCLDDPGDHSTPIPTPRNFGEWNLELTGRREVIVVMVLSVKDAMETFVEELSVGKRMTFGCLERNGAECSTYYAGNVLGSPGRFAELALALQFGLERLRYLVQIKIRHGALVRTGHGRSVFRLG
jgi:hypothetical protein